ncbi:MAG: DnaJ domain-containing protein [Myxococcota bacterium]
MPRGVPAGRGAQGAGDDGGGGAGRARGVGPPGDAGALAGWGGDALAAHYAVLGLAPGAGYEAVRAAYRRAARQHHPDRTGEGDARMKRINAAHAALRAALAGRG